MSTLIDLNEPRFRQGPVLEMVPDLTGRTLQNWHARHTSPAVTPGRWQKRMYSGAAVIALAAMAPLTRLGIPTTAAAKIGERIALRAVEVHSFHPHREEDGVPRFSVLADAMDLYHRGLILRVEGELVILIGKNDEQMRPMLPYVYVTVEVDQLALGMFNKIYDQIHGIKRPPTSVDAPTPEAAAVAEQALSLATKIGPV